MEEIFGHHNLLKWIGVLVWGFFIQFFYKLYRAPKFKNGFDWKYFWNDNGLDFIKNIGLSFIILRLGDSSIHQLFDWVQKEIPRFPLNGEGLDIVIAVSLISSVVSYLLHKFFRKPISEELKKEMHIHNENCKY